LLTAAQNAYTAGSNWAFAFALLAVAVGALLVFLKFPKKQEEIALIQQYQKGS
jgi:hypothetical protein